MRTVDYTEFQKNQEVDLADDEEDSLQSNDMRSTSSCSGNSIPTHSQTKSASKGEKKNQKGMKEVQSLILLWLRFEVLFNANWRRLEIKWILYKRYSRKDRRS